MIYTVANCFIWIQPNFHVIKFQDISEVKPQLKNPEFIVILAASFEQETWKQTQFIIACWAIGKEQTLRKRNSKVGIHQNHTSTMYFMPAFLFEIGRLLHTEHWVNRHSFSSMKSIIHCFLIVHLIRVETTKPDGYFFMISFVHGILQYRSIAAVLQPSTCIMKVSKSYWNNLKTSSR